MTEVRGNVIVGQSGGPTAVINSSLAGVFKTAKDRGARKVYGHASWHTGTSAGAVCGSGGAHQV